MFYMFIVGINKDVASENWLFPTIWMIIIILLTIATYEAWNFYKTENRRKIFAGLFIINGLLIKLWSVLIFTKNAPETALFACIGLLVIAESMIITGFYTNKKSSYILLPYLGWILYLIYWNIGLITG